MYLSQNLAECTDWFLEGKSYRLGLLGRGADTPRNKLVMSCSVYWRDQQMVRVLIWSQLEFLVNNEFCFLEVNFYSLVWRISFGTESWECRIPLSENVIVNRNFLQLSSSVVCICWLWATLTGLCSRFWASKPQHSRDFSSYLGRKKISVTIR